MKQREQIQDLLSRKLEKSKKTNKQKSTSISTSCTPGNSKCELEINQINNVKQGLTVCGVCLKRWLRQTPSSLLPPEQSQGVNARLKPPPPGSGVLWDLGVPTLSTPDMRA